MNKNNQSDEESTRTVVKSELSALRNAIEYKPTDCARDCVFEKQKDQWLDSRFLKTAGVIIGILSPLFVWIVVNIFEIKSEAALQRQESAARNAVVEEMRSDLKEIKRDIGSIKIQLAKDGRISWLGEEK